MRIFFIISILALGQLAYAGNGKITGSRTTSSETEWSYEADENDYAEIATQLDEMGMGFEAENIRTGRPTGQFFVDQRGLKYVFIIMKMALAVYLQGIS